MNKWTEQHDEVLRREFVAIGPRKTMLGHPELFGDMYPSMLYHHARRLGLQRSKSSKRPGPHGADRLRKMRAMFRRIYARLEASGVSRSDV